MLPRRIRHGEDALREPLPGFPARYAFLTLPEWPCREMLTPVTKPRSATRLAALACLGLLLSVSGSNRIALGQQRLQEDFEGPTASWQVLQSDAKFQVPVHQRTTEEQHQGQASETVRLIAGNGSYLFLGHPLAPARVIRELRPSLWVKGDRPGAQLLLRIVLPRTQHPQSGQPLAVLVQGDIYRDAGSWQQLRVPDLLSQLAGQTRVLRQQYGSQVDAREAYVDRLVLNVYCGTGAAQFWLDDLEVEGAIPVAWRSKTPVENEDGSGGAGSRANIQLTAGARQDNRSQASQRLPEVQSKAVPAAEAPQPVRPRLRGTSLSLGGRPMLPRIVQYQGERPQFLKQLGFNAVLLSQMPSKELEVEAHQAGLWLVAPPPAAETLQAAGRLDPHPMIMSWHLGRDLASADIPRVQRTMDLLRGRDPFPGRPGLAAPHSEVRRLSRLADVLILGENPLAGSLSLTGYAKRLTTRARLARPGTPLWVRVPTELPRQLSVQLAALRGVAVASHPSSFEQMRTVAFTALASGARGLLFESYTPLDARTPQAKLRRECLQLLNAELQLIEAWAAGGTMVSAAGSSVSDMVGAVLQTSRARVLLPIRTGRSDQIIPPPPPVLTHFFTIPGVPDSSDVYELAPGGVRPLANQRVTGGVRVTIERGESGSLLLLTGDPLLVSHLAKSTRPFSRQAAQLGRELAAHGYAVAERVERDLSEGRIDDETDKVLREVQASLTAASTSFSSGDFQRSYQASRIARRTLARLQRVRWQRTVGKNAQVVENPFALQYATLPDLIRLRQRLAGASFGENLLREGDFENLELMLSGGWQHFQHAQTGIASDVELSPITPFSGRLSLRLRAWAEETSGPYAFAETAPVWVSTPGVPIRGRQLYRIRGRVRIGQEITGSQDGLMIIDSLGGRPLAQRLPVTSGSGWQPFELYRAAPENSELRVIFALTGFGEAWVDDVAIEPVLFESAPASSPEPGNQSARALFSPPALGR